MQEVTKWSIPQQVIVKSLICILKGFCRNRVRMRIKKFLLCPNNSPCKTRERPKLLNHRLCSTERTSNTPMPFEVIGGIVIFHVRQIVLTDITPYIGIRPIQDWEKMFCSFHERPCVTLLWLIFASFRTFGSPNTLDITHSDAGTLL